MGEEPLNLELAEQKLRSAGWNETTEGCWEWGNALNREGGYGVLRVGPKIFLTHRLSYLIWNGEIGEGMVVCHRCDNPLCLNPEHLFVGTHADNRQDAKNKGRTLRGSANPNAKLNEEKVEEIRCKLDEGRSQRGLAREYEVSPQTINNIAKNEYWVKSLGHAGSWDSRAVES